MAMDKLDEYKWWGKPGEPPQNLKTKKQLAELGLSPAKAVGIIRAQKYDVLLYDPDNPESCRPKRKPTEKQLETLPRPTVRKLESSANITTGTTAGNG